MTKGSIVNLQMIMLSHKWEDQVIKWAVNSNIKTLARDRILINLTKEVKDSSQVCISSVHHTSRQFLQRDTLALSAMKKAIGFTMASLKTGDNVYIHCVTGLPRGPAVATLIKAALLRE